MSVVNHRICVSRVGVLVALVGVWSGCSDAPEPSEESLGSIRLNLVGQSASGNRYRLRNALITVTGAGSAVVWNTEDSPDLTSLSANVVTGDYSASLRDGWFLERITGAVSAPVGAVLTSANPALFTVAPLARTAVPLQFRVDDVDVVDMSQGYDITISVQEPVCGDGVRDANEQCDDGNTRNLDGCDSHCRFEEVQRITSLQQQFVTDAFCPANALGAAFTDEFGRAVIQQTWDAPISDGTLSIVFQLLGLKDLTGGDTPVTLGFVKARAGGRPLVELPTCGNGVCEEGPFALTSEYALLCPQDCVYDGNRDLDWWYVRDPSSVDANEIPTQQLSGQIAAHRLTAGPGTVTLGLQFAFQPSDVTLFNTKIDAAIDGAVNTPTIATTGKPPGHLASEHLSPALTSVSGSTTGKLCAQVSAGSMFRTRIPTLLQQVCTDASAGETVFTDANTLLDVFVVGCTLFGAPGIDPSQPDGALDGATYRFTVNSARTVTGCTRNGRPAAVSDCVAQATWSSYFRFATDRVILKRE